MKSKRHPQKKLYNNSTRVEAQETYVPCRLAFKPAFDPERRLRSCSKPPALTLGKRLVQKPLWCQSYQPCVLRVLKASGQTNNSRNSLDPHRQERMSTRPGKGCPAAGFQKDIIPIKSCDSQESSSECQVSIKLSLLNWIEFPTVGAPAKQSTPQWPL